MEITTKRTKPLSVFTLAMINVIAIDSLRNLPINAEYGYAIIFMYLLGALLFLLPVGLVTAELATNRPQTGGSYIWVRDAFGPRWGFVNTWLLWIYNVVWFPTILSFIAASIAYLINPALASNKPFMVSIILAAFIIATLLNARGMRTAGWISIVGALVGTIIPMAFIIALGIAWFVKGNPAAIPVTTASFFPSIKHIGDLAFIVVIMFSLIGLEMSAVHAGDVKTPKKDFPRALMLSSVIIIISVIFASLAIVISLPKHSINIVSGLNQAFAAFLSAYHLQYLMPVAVILIIVGGFAGMAAWVLGPARAMSVAAQDGCAPKWFAKSNKKGAPVRVLLLQAVIVCILCSLFLVLKSLSTTYWILSDLTAQLALLYYLVLFAAAIRLRYKTPIQTGCFRIPGKNWGIWVVCLIGMLTCLAAIALGFLPPSEVSVGNVAHYEWTLVIGILVFSLPAFLIYRTNKQGSARIK